MAVSRTLARPLLASMFIMGGADALLHPESKSERAKDVGPKMAAPLGLPEDPETLVKINGAVQIGAGSLLALGKVPRLASVALAASLVPTTLAGHRFWEETDERARAMQRIQFFKNLSMLGGLLLAAVDTGGRPSLSWRAHRAAEHAADRVGDVAGHVRPTSH
jgi:putative oxidoreductase